MNLLVEDAAQARRIESESCRLRPHVRGQVKSRVAVEVRVAIEAGHAKALVGALAILGLVKLLLRKRGQQHPQAFDLYRRQNADHLVVIVFDGQQLAARDVAQLGVCRQEDRWRELGCQMVGEVEIDIEAPQVAGFLVADLVDLIVGKDLPASCLLDMRQRQEPARKQVAFADLVGGHRGKVIPGHALRQLDPNTALHRLAPTRHHLPGYGPVTEIISLLEQRPLALHYRRFRRLVVRFDGAKGQRRQWPIARIRRQRIGQHRHGRQGGARNKETEPLKRHFGLSPGAKSREQDATAATNAAFKREFRLFKVDQLMQQAGAAPRTLASVSEAPGTTSRVTWYKKTRTVRSDETNLASWLGR